MQLHQLSFEEAVNTAAGALAQLVVPGPAPAPVRKAYSYEPIVFEEAYPALTIQHTGFRVAVAGNLPAVLGFTVRIYYPVAMGTGTVDGFKIAQEQVLKAISAWFTALEGDRYLSRRALMTATPEGRTVGVAEQGKSVLYVYEVEVEVTIRP